MNELDAALDRILESHHALNALGVDLEDSQITFEAFKQLVVDAKLVASELHTVLEVLKAAQVRLTDGQYRTPEQRRCIEVKGSMDTLYVFRPKQISVLYKNELISGSKSVIRLKCGFMINTNESVSKIQHLINNAL